VDRSLPTEVTRVGTTPTGALPLAGKQTPWYRASPARAVTVAGALFLVISVVQWFNDGSGQAIAVLYVLPIALLAVTLGERGGLAGATFGFVLFAVFEVVHSTGDIDVTGWVARATGMFVLGWLLGRATDQTMASERATLAEHEQRCRLEEANHRYCEALEIQDSIIQQIVAAKWMVEQDHTEAATEILTETIARAQRMVAGLLPARIRPPRPGDGAMFGGLPDAPIRVESPYHPEPLRADAEDGAVHRSRHGEGAHVGTPQAAR
jgi:hypothetical protein